MTILSHPIHNLTILNHSRPPIHNLTILSHLNHLTILSHPIHNLTILSPPIHNEISRFQISKFPEIWLWPGRAGLGPTGLGQAWPDWAGLVRAGWAGLGQAQPGWARPNRVRHGRTGAGWVGWAGLGRAQPGWDRPSQRAWPC